MKKTKKKKPTKGQVAKNFKSIDYYKWEFLRRNVDYLRDCEKWIGRDKKKWRNNEIIVGYPYVGKLTDFSKEQRFQLANKKVKAYWDKYKGEWQALTEDFRGMAMLRKAGLNPPQFSNQSSWLQYSARWKINLPLNPNFDYQPWFVRIARKPIISEPMATSVENNVFLNDIFLEKGTSSLIEVSWDCPTKYLEHVFSNMIKAKKEYLRVIGKNPVDTRARFDKFDHYLKVWNMRYKEKLSVAQIVDAFQNGNQDKALDEDTSVDDIERALGAIAKLIEDGYQNIG